MSQIERGPFRLNTRMIRKLRNLKEFVPFEELMFDGVQGLMLYGRKCGGGGSCGGKCNYGVRTKIKRGRGRD